jgi:hypothetical protein
MKHLLRIPFCLSLVLSLLCAWIPGTLRAEQITWSYCEGAIAAGTSGVAYGLSGVTVECAIRIPANELLPFAGNRLTAIRVGMMDNASDVDSLTVWVRTNRDSANVAEQRYYGLAEGWNEVALPEGYALTGESELYIGFSYTQRKKLIAISIAGPAAEDGAWSRAISSKGVASEWSHPYASRGSMAIEAVIEGEQMPQHAVELSTASLTAAKLRIGSDLTLKGSVRNLGLRTVERYYLAYSFDDSDEIVATDTVLADVPYHTSATFRTTVPTATMNSGAHTLHVQMTFPGMTERNYEIQSRIDLPFTLLDNAYARYCLIEEFTSEYCVNCPEAITRIENAIDQIETPEQVIWVAHHGGYAYDPFTIDASKEYEWFYTEGYYSPAIIYDRTRIEGLSDYQSVINSVGTAAEIGSLMTAEIEAMARIGLQVEVSQAEGQLLFTVHGEKDAAFDDECPAPYLHLMLKEDGIASINQIGASSSFVHNNALRAVVTPIWGEPIVWEGNEFTMHYAYTPDEAWDLAQMQAVAFVSERSETLRTGNRIFNAAMSPIGGNSAALDHVSSEASMVAQEYFTLDGRRCAAQVLPTPHILLRRTRYADGTVRVEKVFR